MGRRFQRRLTRDVKKAKKHEAIKSVIRTGLNGGESFRNIASRIGMDFHIDKDQALGMVLKEYRMSVQTQQARAAAPVKHASLFHPSESFTG